MKRVRLKGLIPLVLFLVAFVVAIWLLLDPLVKWGVEDVGTELVGAKVDLASADVHLFKGSVTLNGLQVTDPAHPMTNLVQAEQIVADVSLAPLLEKKLVLDTVAVRGVRFGTPRKTSGALANPGPNTGAVARAVSDWADRMHLPSLSLAGLGQVVNVAAISPDSLTTLRQAKQIAGSADSAKTAWLESLTALNPKPHIDSAAALAERLKGKNIGTLGLAGARDAAQSVKRTIDSLTALDGKLKALQADVTQGVGRLQTGVTDGLAAARRADYAYARSLLKLPAIAAPDIGPALFGRMVTDKIAPLLYWLNLAQKYMPPGLAERLDPGPKRMRASGTDARFPREHDYPTFLLRFGEASLSLGGQGAAAGNYDARVTGVTSAPTLYGKPTTFTVSRTAAAVGPTSVRASGMLDHVRRPLRDSVDVSADGITLPTVQIGAFGATLDLGKGSSQLMLARTGDSLSARWVWHSNDVTWTRQGGSVAGAAGGAGIAQAAQEMLWNTISGLKDVQVEARLSGPIASPRLAIGTNVADAVSQSLQRQLGDKVKQAEAQVRARVDSLVASQVSAARSAVDSVRSTAQQAVDEQRAKLDQAKKDLESRLKSLVGGLPIGG